MTDLEPFEQGTQAFRGVVKVWTDTFAELQTDSGIVVFLDVRGQPAMAPGSRIAITTRKYRPCHQVMRVSLA